MMKKKRTFFDVLGGLVEVSGAGGKGLRKGARTGFALRSLLGIEAIGSLVGALEPRAKTDRGSVERVAVVNVVRSLLSEIDGDGEASVKVTEIEFVTDRGHVLVDSIETFGGAGAKV